MTCRTCRLWDQAAARLPNGRLRPKANARCLWRFPDIAIPDSLGPNTGTPFRAPAPSFMRADDGEGCAAWEALTGVS